MTHTDPGQACASVVLGVLGHLIPEGRCCATKQGGLVVFYDRRVELRRRPSGDDRRRALDAYLAELVKLDWKTLSANAPDAPGYWPIEGLETRRDRVNIRPSFFVPFGDGDLCVIVDASGSGMVHRVVVDGFALRDGCTPQDLTDAEWADLNI